MNTDIFLAISAGATFLLALAAFWAIWQNYRLRKEDRDLKFKMQALDGIREWAKEFSQILVLSGRKNDMEKVQLLSRLGALIVEDVHMFSLAIIFDKEIGNKINEVNNCITEFRKRVTNNPSGVNEPLLAITEENKSFTTKAFDSINHLVALVSMTKIELLSSKYELKT